MEKPYVVGMDIGGTNTVFGVVDSRGNVLASDSVKTQQYTEVSEYVDAVCKKLLPLLQQFGGAEKIKGVGVGAPNGNYYSGTIEFAPNLHGRELFLWLLCSKNVWVFLQRLQTMQMRQLSVK